MTPTVVILSRDAGNLVPCVNAIQRHDPGVSIIVVDDGAQANVTHELPVRWVEGRKPFVFATNANIGIAAAGRDDVLLLNDDTLLETPGGFTKLKEQLDRHSTYGVVSAVTNSVGNVRQYRERANPSANGIIPEPRMVCFVGVMLRRSMIEQIGGLDEDFNPGFFEDDEYCFRARAKGWHIGIWDGCFLDHKSLHSSFRSGKDTSREMFTSLALYEKKCGRHPEVPPEWRVRMLKMGIG